MRGGGELMEFNQISTTSGYLVDTTVRNFKLDGLTPMLEVPSNLLRFFAREEHALQFISGKIRCGLLTYYRNIEGTRQDAKEGQTSFYWSRKASQFQIDNQTGRLLGPTESTQNIRYRGSSLNSYYIVSTSSSDADKYVLKERFGRFTVLISDPKALLERIRAIWHKHEWALNDGVVIVPAEYNKDELVAANQYLIAPPHYSYSQKPPSFCVEKEFRFILTCSIDVNRQLSDHLSLDVGDCADICHFL